MAVARIVPEENEKLIRKGYLEYRKAFYLLLLRECERNHFFDYLREPRTLVEIQHHFNYRRDRLDALQGVLDSLVILKAVEVSHNDQGEAVYSASETEIPLEVNRDYLVLGAGKNALEGLEHARGFAKDVFAYLSGTKNAVTFDVTSLDIWQDYLQYPFYAYGRDLAVQWIAKPGSNVLDLGSGLGHGTRRLCEIVGSDGRVIALEVSADFLDLSRKVLQDFKDVQFLHADMNHGFEALGDQAFDGVMAIGSFHFVRDKLARLRELSTLICPGGRLAIGNLYQDKSSFDQGILNLAFAMMSPRALPVTPGYFMSILDEVGFIIDHHFDLGALGWYYLTRV